MNKREYLLTKLVEECLEVAQRATKAMTFGIDEIQPGQSLTNFERLNGEWNDLLATAELMAEEVDLELWRITSLIEAKREKILKFMDYSRECGTLTEDPVKAPTGNERCDACGKGFMRSAPGGGIKCDKCPNWFCH